MFGENFQIHGVQITGYMFPGQKIESRFTQTSRQNFLPGSYHQPPTPPYRGKLLIPPWHQFFENVFPPAEKGVVRLLPKKAASTVALAVN